MRFQVLSDGEPRVVNLAFGGEGDLAVVGRWRAPAALEIRPGVRDTIEFARLASKRWRYYRRSIATANSVAKMCRMPAVTDHFFIRGTGLKLCRTQSRQ